MAFVLGASVVFSRSAKVERCHALHRWTVMWRTAVQPLPPKNLRRFASIDLDGVFDGVWVSGFYLLPAAAAISVATFWCLLFKASARTNKRSRALSWNNEAPTNSRNFKQSDWIKTGNHHATSWIIYMIYNIIYNICIYIYTLFVTSNHCGAECIDSMSSEGPLPPSDSLLECIVHPCTSMYIL